MTSTITTSFMKQRIEIITRVIGYGVIIFSIIIMMMWILAPSLFETLLPQSATEKFNTALLFGLCAFYSISGNVSVSWLRQWRTYIPVIIILISGITLLASLTATPTFLDQLIVPDPLTSPDALPGQMSGITTFLFLLMGVAFVASHKSTAVAEQIGVFVNLIALVAVFAFLFDFEALYSVFFFSTVSIFTGIQFVLISLIFLFSLSDGVIYNLISSDSPAGIVARRLFPAILVVPTVLGWLILQGANIGIYQPVFALVLMIMLTVAIELIMVIMHTAALQRWYYKNKQMQQQLLDREIERLELENIREINKLKEEFFAQLSHDMRSPLTTILLSSDVMMQYEDQLSKERRVQHLQKIRYQARSMLDFVDDMVLLSQFELTSMPFEPSTNDIIAFCKAYHNEFIQYNTLDNHDFQVVLPDISIYVDFDKRLIRRLLNNLVSNAIKYSPDGGHVILKLEVLGTITELSVQDEGIGIPAKNMDSLFELFTRAGNVSEIKGYGLGLAIVKKVVDAHHATIAVDSTEGQGTTFTIRLTNLLESQSLAN